MNETDETKSIIARKSVLRLYLNGFIALGIIYLIIRVIHDLSPWYAVFDNPTLTIILTILTLLLGPPLLGCLVQYVINPLLGRWNTWSELVLLQDRLIGEFSQRSELPIVLINWPSETIRTMGILTSRIKSKDEEQEMGAVYVTTAPRNRFGYVRIVPIDEIEFTNWTLKEFQAFQWTVGSISPDHFGELTESPNAVE